MVLDKLQECYQIGYCSSCLEQLGEQPAMLDQPVMFNRSKGMKKSTL